MDDGVNAADGSDDREPTASKEALPEEPLVGQRLHARHRITDFACPRSPKVEEFLKKDALKLEQRQYTKVFVLENPHDPTEVWGYYSLSAYSVPRQHVSTQQQKLIQPGLPVPFALIGHMGRSVNSPAGFGGGIVADAARRAYRNSALGAWGLFLHAEDNNRDLVARYVNLGFRELLTAEKQATGFMFARYVWIDESLV